MRAADAIISKPELLLPAFVRCNSRRQEGFHLLEVCGSGATLACQRSNLRDGLGYPLPKSWTSLNDIKHQAEIPVYTSFPGLLHLRRIIEMVRPILELAIVETRRE